MAALCALAVIALAPSPVQAGCAHWSVAGFWDLYQSDDIKVQMNLHQNGNDVGGTAAYLHNIVKGEVRGTVQGNRVNLRVVWQDGNSGRWEGQILPSGTILGTSHDEKVHAYKATFYTAESMTCTDNEVAKTLVKRAPEQLPGYIRINKPCPVTVNFPGSGGVHFRVTLDVGDQYPLVSRKGDIVTLKYTTEGNGTVDVPVSAVDLPNKVPNRVLPLPKAQGATPGSTPTPPRFKPVKKLKITPTT